MRQLTFQRVLGSGAFGTVYLAELTGARGFRRTVAVKVLLPGQPDSASFVSRVRDEARLLGLLHDEHILKVLELVRVGERDAVVMEFVEGVDLSGLISSGQRPPPRALAELGAAVAGALHAAHTARHPNSGEPLNVVHRDVKPANVMITDRGGVKLLDFGVAQARFAARESRTGQFVLGTLNYMAPEYIITGDVSPAADVYGLGLTLWEAAVGEVFGQPKLKEEAHVRRVEEHLARLTATHAELTPVLRPMFAWDPTARPNAATVEGQLVAAADRLSGTGLRSWAASHVPPAIERARKDAKDTVGLAGQTVTVASEPSEASGPAAAPAEPESPEEYTLLRVDRPAFLDEQPRLPPSVTPAAHRPPPAPTPYRAPPAPPPRLSPPAAAPPPPVARASVPVAPPAPNLRSRVPASPAVLAPAPAAPTPVAPLPPVSTTPPPSGRRAKKPAKGVPVWMVVVQALLVGGFVGLALVVTVGLYLMLNRGGP
ncbi:hypothetical protein LBMAG42_27480 [Deltaproteobacteria bacterium]|nr:hypothetical protein LBMAG42_27480 [Deltaproteobacteria bacterium]